MLAKWMLPSIDNVEVDGYEVQMKLFRTNNNLNLKRTA